MRVVRVVRVARVARVARVVADGGDGREVEVGVEVGVWPPAKVRRDTVTSALERDCVVTAGELLCWLVLLAAPVQ